MSLITKKEKFVKDAGDHKFRSLESEMVYENPIKGIPKKKQDGRIVPEKFQGLKKITYSNMLFGTTGKEMLTAAKIMEGQVPDVDLKANGWKSISANHALYQHEKTNTIALKGYAHPNLINKKSKSVYETADGRLLTPDEVTEFYSYMSEKKANTYNLDNEVEFRNYDVSKVRYFRNGELEFNDLSDEILQKLGLR